MTDHDGWGGGPAVPRAVGWGRARDGASAHSALGPSTPSWRRPGELAAASREWAYCHYDALSVWGRLPCDALMAFPGDVGTAKDRRAVRIEAAEPLMTVPDRGASPDVPWRSFVAVHRSWWTEASDWLRGISAVDARARRFWRATTSRVTVTSPTGGPPFVLHVYGVDATDGRWEVVQPRFTPAPWPLRWRCAPPSHDTRVLGRAVLGGEAAPFAAEDEVLDEATIARLRGGGNDVQQGGEHDG